MNRPSLHVTVGPLLRITAQSQSHSTWGRAARRVNRVQGARHARPRVTPSSPAGAQRVWGAHRELHGFLDEAHLALVKGVLTDPVPLRVRTRAHARAPTQTAHVLSTARPGAAPVHTCMALPRPTAARPCASRTGAARQWTGAARGIQERTRTRTRAAPRRRARAPRSAGS